MDSSAVSDARRSRAAKTRLIPHVQETHPGNDDSILATELLREISPAAKRHTRLAAGDFSAAEYKAMIGRCEVLAERMHAAIAGLSSRVSTVVVGYSVKARGILFTFWVRRWPRMAS